VSDRGCIRQEPSQKLTGFRNGRLTTLLFAKYLFLILLWGSHTAAAQDFTAAADAYLKAEVRERKFMGTVLIARPGEVLF